MEGLSAGVVRPRVLDVGGREGALAEFLPGADVIVLDIRPPATPAERILSAQGRYVVGDIVAGPVPGAPYDVVFSMDMLEHIPGEQRAAALRNMLGAARLGTVIGFPIDSPEVNRAEDAANARYRELYGNDHPWLLEHFACRPLPNPAEIEALLRKEGYAFRRFGGNNLSLWLLMMEFLFLAWRKGIPTEAVQAVYREEFLAGRLGDAREPSYRVIYAIVPGQIDESRLGTLRIPIDEGHGGAPGRRALTEALVEAMRGVSGTSGPIEIRHDLEAELSQAEKRLGESNSECESLRSRLDQRERTVAAIHASLAWRLVQAVRGLFGRRW